MMSCTTCGDDIAIRSVIDSKISDATRHSDLGIIMFNQLPWAWRGSNPMNVFLCNLCAGIVWHTPLLRPQEINTWRYSDSKNTIKFGIYLTKEILEVNFLDLIHLTKIDRFMK